MKHSSCIAASRVLLVINKPLTAARQDLRSFLTVTKFYSTRIYPPIANVGVINSFSSHSCYDRRGYNCIKAIPVPLQGWQSSSAVIDHTTWFVNNQVKILPVQQVSHVHLCWWKTGISTGLIYLFCSKFSLLNSTSQSRSCQTMQVHCCWTSRSAWRGSENFRSCYSSLTI